jgi:DNA-binding PadR family transcriptional regulator
MRLTLPTATVLAALAHGHRYGFEILDVTGLRAGTVYPVLRRLEEGAMVASSWEDAADARAEGRPARRNYRLSPEGLRFAREAAERYPTLARVFDVPPREDAAPA